jgi:hypothetical protein
LDGRGKRKVWDRREMHAEIWWGNPKELYATFKMRLIWEDNIKVYLEETG